MRSIVMSWLNRWEPTTIHSVIPSCPLPATVRVMTLGSFFVWKSTRRSRVLDTA